jgi:uncharacterized membrane protein YhaH (DUF805 family)
MNPIVRPWRQVLDFKGRATRTEYALFHVTAIVGMIVLELLSVAIVAAAGAGGADRSQPSTAAIVVSMIFGLVFFVGFFAFLIGHIAIGVRRLHDHGEPGIRYLLTFIPLIGFIFWLMMVFTRGDDYENDYGPDPRQPDQIAVEELGAVFE